MTAFWLMATILVMTTLEPEFFPVVVKEARRRKAEPAPTNGSEKKMQALEEELTRLRGQLAEKSANVSKELKVQETETRNETEKANFSNITNDTSVENSANALSSETTVGMNVTSLQEGPVHSPALVGIPRHEVQFNLLVKQAAKGLFWEALGGFFGVPTLAPLMTMLMVLMGLMLVCKNGGYDGFLSAGPWTADRRTSAYLAGQQVAYGNMRRPARRPRRGFLQRQLLGLGASGTYRGRVERRRLPRPLRRLR